MIKALTVLALATAGSASSPALIGSWYGSDLALKVTAEGATLNFDCASFRVSEPLMLDKRGRFQALSRFSKARPGPQLADVEPSTSSVKISGMLHGPTLSLELAEPGQTPKAYVLERSGSRKLVRCL